MIELASCESRNNRPWSELGEEVVLSLASSPDSQARPLAAAQLSEFPPASRIFQSRRRRLSRPQLEPRNLLVFVSSDAELEPAGRVAQPSRAGWERGRESRRRLICRQSPFVLLADEDNRFEPTATRWPASLARSQFDCPQAGGTSSPANCFQALSFGKPSKHCANRQSSFLAQNWPESINERERAETDRLRRGRSS